MLASELAVQFRHHDDGSEPAMPDLVSVDGLHVAEVVTTAPFAVRQAEKHLEPVPEPRLPHCVWVTIPRGMLPGATRAARSAVRADILRWAAESPCQDHWPRANNLQPPPPLIGLRKYDDGVTVFCVRQCQHADDDPHRIVWPVLHARSDIDPWQLIDLSLAMIEREQRGGVVSLVRKLAHYPNKHLVMYPFGSPGNPTAAISHFTPPGNPLALMPKCLPLPLSAVQLWLVYRYDLNGVAEGLRVWSGGWSRFGA
ncbi:hypothetical protein [Plantibacter flavus]|uniref:hypothetical protein n=1 Tax=Plantibacter flavus TaxID=150123 RepID=UPI00339611F3